MPFLELNGYAVPILNAQAAQGQTRRGRRDRSYRGQVRDNRRAIRRVWNCAAKFKDWNEAEALQNLIWGNGHACFAREGFQHSTGLNPLNIDMTRFRALPDVELRPGRGVGGFYSPDTDGQMLTFGLQAEDCWTVIWEEGNDIRDVGLKARTSDGVGYEDGVRNDRVGARFGASNIFIWIPSGGDLGMQALGGAEGILGDVILLPWRASEEQLAAFTATRYRSRDLLPQRSLCKTYGWEQPELLCKPRAHG
jgi:hypothetical protein